MKNVKINQVGTIRLNSFKPLCVNDFGKLAIAKYGFLPFIDASCRREPDFENPFPSISALCRKGKFAPKLNENDVVVYITVQGNYQTDEIKKTHSRLVAIVKVIKTFESHKLAADWYLDNNLSIPNNCMIEGNLPKLFDQTAAVNYFKGKKDIKNFLNKSEEHQKRYGEIAIKKWDSDYQERANTWQKFVVTKPIFLNLESPPILLREDFLEIFNRVPNTQTPNKINKIELIELAKIAGINLYVE
jgi:hypothetical protein